MPICFTLDLGMGNQIKFHHIVAPFDILRSHLIMAMLTILLFTTYLSTTATNAAPIKSDFSIHVAGVGLSESFMVPKPKATDNSISFSINIKQDNSPQIYISSDVDPNADAISFVSFTAVIEFLDNTKGWTKVEALPLTLVPVKAISSFEVSPSYISFNATSVPMYTKYSWTGLLMNEELYKFEYRFFAPYLNLYITRKTIKYDYDSATALFSLNDIAGLAEYFIPDPSQPVICTVYTENTLPPPEMADGHGNDDDHLGPQPSSIPQHFHSHSRVSSHGISTRMHLLIIELVVIILLSRRVILRKMQWFGPPHFKSFLMMKRKRPFRQPTSMTLGKARVVIGWVHF